MATATRRKVDLDALSAEQVEVLVAQLKAREDAEKNAAQLVKDEQRNLVAPVAEKIATDYEPREFSTGSQGWQVSVTMDHPVHGKVTGQLLLTIKSTVKR